MKNPRIPAEFFCCSFIRKIFVLLTLSARYFQWQKNFSIFTRNKNFWFTYRFEAASIKNVYSKWEGVTSLIWFKNPRKRHPLWTLTYQIQCTQNFCVFGKIKKVLPASEVSSAFIMPDLQKILNKETPLILFTSIHSSIIHISH